MRRSISKLLGAALIAVFLLTQATPASAKSELIKVQTSSFQLNFDGKSLLLPSGQYVFAVNGTSYVPLRFVSYALKKTVEWNGNTSTVTVAEPTKDQLVILNEYLMNATARNGNAFTKGNVAINVTPKAAKFIFDGKEKKITSGQSAYMLDGTLYVPVRFMSESTGVAIQWDPVKKQITGESKLYQEQNKGNNTNPPSGPDKGTTGNNAGGNNGSGSNGGGSAGNPGVPAKPTYESITASAEQRLTTLEDSTKNQLIDLALTYLKTTDKTEKKKLVEQGNSIVASATAQFNQIVSETEKQLTANGYSTKIIAEYKTKFNEQLALGKEILDGMMS